MGRSTIATIVPFKMKSQIITDIIQRMSKDMFDDDIQGVENGWTFYWDVAKTYIGKNKKTLYCDILKKDETEILVVNESEWASGGDYNYCIFSTDQSSLLKFCNDFQLTPNITTDDVVQQTL